MVAATSKNLNNMLNTLEGDSIILLKDLNAYIVLSGDTIKNWSINIIQAIEFYTNLNLDYLFLIKPKKPPIFSFRLDGKCDCAIFTKNLLDEEKGLDEESADVLYRSAKKMIDSEIPLRVMARTFDDLTDYGFPHPESASLSISVPHQGDLKLLNTCLGYITSSQVQPEEVLVYFDEETNSEHNDLVGRYSQFRFAKIVPPNFGPYVARNHSGEIANTDYICFQDSDDIPTTDRFCEIAKYTNNNKNVDMAGCHEIRVDEIEKKVFIFRFPVNVSYALKKTASHPQFHPTTFVKKEKLDAAGGFSTIRRYGADLQFLLRSYFFLNIRNLDKFLYIRRKRPGSLTTDDKTKLNSKERLYLDDLWKADFQKVKDGQLALQKSSLIAEGHDQDVKVEGFLPQTTC